MRPSIEVSIDLTAQELLELPSLAELEIDDICTVETLQIAQSDLSGQSAANLEASQRIAALAADGTDISIDSLDDSVEIEFTLTPMEINSMLDGTWKPTLKD